MNIKNLPEAAMRYEFIVADCHDDNLYFVDMYTDGFQAEERAKGLRNGVVIHNVRIQGFEPEKRTFTFSGEWHWECEAVNKSEAITRYVKMIDAFKQLCREKDENLFRFLVTENIEDSDGE